MLFFCMNRVYMYLNPKMESGKKTTTSEKIAKLCQHYHVSADYLLGLTDDPRGGVERWTEE